jgi:hypothetical protein
VPLAPLGVTDLVPLVPPPAEYTLSLKDADWRVKVNLRPGEPQPGEVLDLTFDLGRAKDGDAGEPQPYNDARLALTVTGPGPKMRYMIRALGDAGVYGVHWTPSARGLWTLTIAPWKDAGPTVSFQVGAGEPMPAASQGHMVQASRMVVAAGGKGPAAPSMKQLMDDLAKRWQKQSDLAQPDAAELKAMSKLLKAIQGRIPKEFTKDSTEFNMLGAEAAVMLDKGALPGAQTCLKCHVKFRDAWASDLTKWPEVRR